MEEESRDKHRPATRGGEGPSVSRTTAKESTGRTFVTREHEGQLSRNTEYLASKRLARGEQKGPTDNEKRDVFESNPTEYKSLKSAGMSDSEIYDILQHRN